MDPNREPWTLDVHIAAGVNRLETSLTITVASSEGSYTIADGWWMRPDRELPEAIRRITRTWLALGALAAQMMAKREMRAPASHRR